MKHNLIEHEIIAGERINGFRLDDDLSGLLERLPEKFERQSLELDWLFIFPPFKVWVNKKNQRITQISVGKGFGGEFLNEIGVGSTLMDVKAVAGEWQEDLEVYTLKRYPGICFELEDIDEWSECSAPIEYISVFRPFSDSKLN